MLRKYYPPPEIIPPALVKVKGNVLVIEDDQDTLEVIGMHLMREGYGVRRVRLRNEALVVLSRYLYDIILMDLNMPGMGPGEFISAVRKYSPRSKFIVTTASEHVELAARKLGVSYWLGKPFTQEDLMEAMRKV